MYNSHADIFYQPGSLYVYTMIFMEVLKLGL